MLEAAQGWWDVGAGKWAGRNWVQGKRDLGKTAMTGLHAAVAQAKKPPFDIDARHMHFRKSGAAGTVLEAFDGLEGLKAARDANGQIERLEVRSEEAYRFVGGGWLEAAVLNRVRYALRGASRVEIVAGVRLGVEGPRTGGANAPPDDSELDVAIVVDDQLHVIEAKAFTVSMPGAIANAVAKLAKIRQELGSQLMGCFLVAPLLNRWDMGRGAFVERAEKQGVRLLYGPRAFDDLEREIAALA